MFCALWRNSDGTLEALGETSEHDNEAVRHHFGSLEHMRIVPDGAFVWYHNGETASKTPFEQMHKIANDYVIGETSLGGAMM